MGHGFSALESLASKNLWRSWGQMAEGHRGAPGLSHAEKVRS